MEHIRILVSILGIHALAVISPGPDFVVAVKNSLSHGRNVGYWTALGFGGGIALHVTYSLFGLALIISQSIVVFTIIKRCGALYLIWIGFQSLLSKGGMVSVSDEDATMTITKQEALKQGFLTNALNPKATLFFLGLFTVVISPETPLRVMGTASMMMVLNTILWFCFISYVCTNPLLTTYIHKTKGKIEKVLGALMILLGGMVLKS